MAERLTPERLAKDAALKYAAKFGDDWDRECGYQDGFTAAYDAQQAEIDRLTSRLESLQALNRHHAAWRAKVMAEVDRNEERHVTTSNRLFDERNQASAEINRLRALLGEARDDIVQASEYLLSFPYPSNCDAIQAFGIMRRLLAKFAQEADRGERTTEAERVAAHYAADWILRGERVQFDFWNGEQRRAATPEEEDAIRRALTAESARLRAKEKERSHEAQEGE